MATKKVAQSGAEPLGIGTGHHTPKKTGIYHEHLTQHSHESEYAAPATAVPNPVQHGYPAERAHSGGKGKKPAARLGGGKVK